MTRSTGRRIGFFRPCARALLLGGALLPAGGCGLLPSRDDLASATTYVKDHVTGKARRDRLTKNYAEARILERRKDFVGAEKLYREVLGEEPRNRDCYHRLAVMSAVQGKYEDARAYYKMALECGPPTADLWSDIGYCHYLQHQLPEAEQALNQALALEPQHGAALNNLAMVVGEQGNLPAAFELFRKANGEAEAECNFAYLCAQCGDLQAASEHFSRALSLDPTMRSAAEALLQVTSKLQQFQALAAEQSGAADGAQATGGLTAESGEVRQATAATPVAVPPRPLIEVYGGGGASRMKPADTAAATAPGATIPASTAATTPATTNAAAKSVPQPLIPAPGPTRPTVLFEGPNSPRPASSTATGGSQNVVGQAGIISPSAIPPSVVQPGIVRPGAVQPEVVQASAIMPLTAPAPFSAPNAPQPQYLQPTNSPAGQPTPTSGSTAPSVR